MDIDADDVEAVPQKKLSTCIEKPKETCIFITETGRKEHFNKLKSFLYSSDEEESSQENKEQISTLQAIDNFSKVDQEVNSQENNETTEEKMDVSVCESDTSEQVNEVSISKNTSPKEKKLMNRKISDYFKKIQKS